MDDEFKKLNDMISNYLKDPSDIREQKILEQLKNLENKKHGFNIYEEFSFFSKENKNTSEFFSEQEISELKSELEHILGKKHLSIKIDFFTDGLIENHTLRRGNFTEKSHLSISDYEWILKENIPLKEIERHKNCNFNINLTYQSMAGTLNKDYQHDIVFNREIWGIRRFINDHGKHPERIDHWLSDKGLEQIIGEEQEIDFGIYNLQKLGLDISEEKWNNPEFRSAVNKFNRDSNKYGIDKNAFKFIGSGANGFVVVFKDEDRYCACKYTSSFLENKEFQKIRFKEDSKHLVNWYGPEKRKGTNIYQWPNTGLILEYYNGESLSDLLDKEKVIFSSDETLKYSAQIFNGLLELVIPNFDDEGFISNKSEHQYHNDLWLGNIIIEKKTDNIKIIDLSLVSSQQDEFTCFNRRYGNQDLLSLGQIMYKMVAGNHIFNGEESIPTYKIPFKIKEKRNEIYSNEELLKNKFSQIDETIEDKNISDIIKFCLKNRKDYSKEDFDKDYKILEEMFNPYYE